jgi:hypothetical protein
MAATAPMAAATADGAAAADRADRAGHTASRIGTVLDDRDLQRAGGWRSKTSALAYRHTLTRSRSKGATLTATPTTYSGGSVSFQTGPGRGKAAIYVGGVHQRTVTTAADKKKTKTVRVGGSGQLVIKVRKPGRGVYVDYVNLGNVVPPPTPPGAGDVIFTEWLSNPAQVTDANGEWFELENVSADTIALDGCSVTNQSAGAATLPYQVLSPDEILLAARSSDSATNGGLPPPQATFTFSLTASGSLTLTCGGTVIDTVSWTTETAGASTSLDPDHYTSTDNDLPGSYCPGATPYGDGDLGTPWSDNPQCP